MSVASLVLNDETLWMAAFTFMFIGMINVGSFRRKIISISKLIVIIILAVIPFLSLIIKDGYFVIGDYIFPLFPEREVARCLSLWDESFLMGCFTAPIPLANLPQYVFYHLLSLFLGIEAASRLLIPVIFIVAAFSIYSLSKYLVKDFLPCLTSTIIYLYNPWTINRILSGHVFLLFAYGLAPLMLLLYFKGVDYRDFKRSIVSSLILALIISISYHLASLLIPLFFIYPLFKSSKAKDLLNHYKLTITTITISILLNSYWLIPSCMVLSSDGVKGTNILDIINLSAESNIVNVLRLHGYFWTKWWDLFRENLNASVIGLWWIVSLLPLTISIPSIFLCRNPKVKLMATAMLIYSILATGLNWPFSSLNKILYENIPLYVIHRDPNKIVSILCLSYSILSAYMLQQVLRNRRGLIISVIIIMLLLANSWPLLTGNLYGFLEPLEPPLNDYVEVDRWLQDKAGEFRVLWLPPIEISGKFTWGLSIKGVWWLLDPLRYSTLSKPNVGFTHIGEWFGGVDRTIWFLHFLYNQIYNGRVRDLIPILKIMNVKYIVFREDVESSSCSMIRRTVEDFMRVKNSLDEAFRVVYQTGMLKVYEVPLELQDYILTFNSSLVIVGDLKALTILPEVENISGMALFLIEDLNIKNLKEILNHSNLTLVFLDSNIIDAALSMMEHYTPSSYAGNGWVPVVYEWSIKELNAIVQRGSIHRGLTYSSSKESSINIKINIEKSHTYTLWIKSWLDIDPASIQISVDGYKLLNITLQSGNPTFRYVRIGEVYLTRGIHNINIKLNSGKAILGDLVVADVEKLNQTLRILDEILENTKVTVVNIHTSDTINRFAFHTRLRSPVEAIVYSGFELETTTYREEIYNVTVSVKGEMEKVKMEVNNKVYNAEIHSGYASSLIHMGKGLNKLKIHILGNASINYIAIATGETKSGNPGKPICIKESPLKYSVKAEKSILLLKQSYSKLWIAQAESTYSSIPSIMFNAYLVESGNITLRNKAEEAYVMGIIISIATLTAIITILSKPYGLQILRKVHLKTLSKG
ncbi:MAG: 6-pyruvoyl-tetrahydropterin synthase-related protein [Candidatus Methanomethylicia archaeon]